MAAKKGLGKGLDALISDRMDREVHEAVQKKDEKVSRETLLPIAKIEPNRNQPRRHFDEDALHGTVAVFPVLAAVPLRVRIDPHLGEHQVAVPVQRQHDVLQRHIDAFVDQHGVHDIVERVLRVDAGLAL